MKISYSLRKLKILFTPSETDENIYTLKISFTEEFLASDAVAGDAAGAVDFKVMYWDGNKAPSEWWPDGVANNGVISEAGEYLLTFNKASTETAEKTDGSGNSLLGKESETLEQKQLLLKEMQDNLNLLMEK